jgi:cobalt-zinc-cadmium efflux system membrane fusion protein
MNAEIEISNIKAMVLPEDAIINFEGTDYVFVQLKEKEYILTEVKTGTKQDNFVEIIDGNALTQKLIVTKGAYTLLTTLKNKPEE